MTYVFNLCLFGRSDLNYTFMTLNLFALINSIILSIDGALFAAHIYCTFLAMFVHSELLM